jgi:predicted translin family RNA/ssDNA-binding protein
MKSFGDDVGEILEYLNEMEIEDLEEISGCFECIYKKFTTEDVWDALEALEKKIDYVIILK